MGFMMTKLEDVGDDQTLGLKEKEYTIQLSAYGGYVYAEVIYRDQNTDYDYESKFWYCTFHKKFGRTFADAPKEKDWQRARKWADAQLELLNKYATVKVKKAECLTHQHLR